MARIQTDTERFMKRLGGQLKEPLAPQQISQLSKAVAKLPADARLISADIDAIAKELNLPAPHKATLIFSLFFQRYQKEVGEALQDEQALSKGLAGAVNVLLKRAHSKDGAETAAALDSFFASFAARDANIANTGKEIFWSTSPRLELATDRVRVPAHTTQAKWFERSVELTLGKTSGTLRTDGDQVFYKDAPISQLTDHSLNVLYNALQNTPVKLVDERKLLQHLQTKVGEAMNQPGKKELFKGQWIDGHGAMLAPPAKPLREDGAFVESGEGGWAFQPTGKKSSIPLGRLSIAELETLSTALTAAIQSPKNHGAKGNPKQAIEAARSLAFAGALLMDVARTIERKGDDVRSARVEAEKTLLEALKGYRVGRLGSDSINALAKAFA